MRIVNKNQDLNPYNEDLEAEIYPVDLNDGIKSLIII